MASLFRRQKEDKHHHTGYRVADVHSDQAVVVEKNSVLVGDIYAPQVLVAGMVYGYVVTGEVIIESSGQIWGDICATSMVAMPGSRVHGWISTLDQGTVDLLRLGQLSLEELPKSGEMATSAERVAELEKLVTRSGDGKSRSSERIEIWRNLRSEAAAAISARVEIEQSFEIAVLEAAKKLSNGLAPGIGYEAAVTKEGSAKRKPGVESEAVIQQSEAESEIRQLKSQLKTALSRHSLLRNQLVWTKALLLQSRRQRQIENERGISREPLLTSESRDRHLAMLQATIVERDIKLEELQARYNIQEEQLSRLKRLAARRIESLELELDRVRGK